jgi:hypothetical protein
MPAINGRPESGRKLGASLLAVAIALAGAGCATKPSGEWENPSKPFEAWDADRTECQDLASQRAEQDYTLQGGGRTPPTYSRTATFQQSMTTFEATQLRQNLFESCMKDRGYRFVPRANPEGSTQSGSGS